MTKALIDKEIFLKERLEEIARIVKKEQKTRKRTVIFCNSRRHAKAVHRHFPDAARYHTGRDGVDAGTLAAFKKGEVATLIVVDKLNECVDVPEADLLVFLRSTDSPRIWMQQLGRGLRKMIGKGNVLVLDFVANCDRLYDVATLASEVKGHLKNASDAVSVHRAGIDINFSVEAREILDVLKRLEKNFYPTLE